MTEEDMDQLESLEEEVPQQEVEAEIAPVPLFAALLKDVVGKIWESDQTMSDFVEHVAAPLSDELGFVAAKGGVFAEKHLAEGRRRVEDYIQDQSMRAHLINGLFPVLHLARTLKSWGAPRLYDDLHAGVHGRICFARFLNPHGTTLEAAGFNHESHW
jgi:CRISPR-associated protein Csc3